MNPLSNFQQVIYGALFHDIGKLFYKAGRESNHIEAGLKAAQQVFDTDEGRIPKVIDHAIRYHHWKNLKTAQNIEPETWLIYEADNIAAGLDRRNEEELAETAPEIRGRKFDPEVLLQSTFSLLVTPDNANNDIADDTDYKAFPANYRLTMLGKEDERNRIFPTYPVQRIEKKADLKASRHLYENIAGKWNTEVRCNKSRLASNPNAMLLLMESLLSFAPSDTCLERIPDISLYEHLRITAAIASCMYIHAVETGETDFKNRGHWSQTQKHRNEKQFLLVGGNLSGIQKFIYNITRKGALKSLRARSFYLEILIEHCIDDILTLAGDEHGSFSRANIIYSGGGHFFLLLPNTERVHKILSEVGTNINEWLWREFKGNLSMALAWEECTANDLMDSKDASRKRQAHMKKIWKNLSDKLSAQKAQRFASMSDDAFSRMFDPDPDDAPIDGKECVITQVDHDLILYRLDQDQDKKPVPCNRMAAALYAFGRKLPNTGFLWIRQGLDRSEFEAQFENSENPPILLLPDLRHPGKYALVQALEAAGNDKDDLKGEDGKAVKNWLLEEHKPGRLYSINRWVLSEHLHANLLVGQYYKKSDKGEMPTFEELAADSEGNQKIGVLRADVDGLGELFSKRLPDNAYTFSRLAMLSKQLTMFFKLYINSICEGTLVAPKDKEYIPLTRTSLGTMREFQKQRSAVIVYAGGDDLFIVGAWNQMIELAIDIRNCFDHFTCGKLTLSAGVQVFDPHVPISAMAELTERAEKKAKEIEDKRKDAICLMPNPDALENKTGNGGRKHRDTYHWRELIETKQGKKASLMSMINRMSPKHENGEGWLSKSLMYQLYKLADVWVNDGYIALPKFAYLFGRVAERFQNAGQKEAEEQEKREFTEIKDFLYDSLWLDGDEEALSKVNIRDFKTMFTIISYLEREK